MNACRRAALLVAAVLAALLVPAGVAHADSSSTLTIVGTSDVSDSGLMNDVIIPEFEKAYPQFTASYVPLGTGAAIAYAEAGTASALIVHAESEENQFVSSGYSYESFGRAVFWGDYVLLGPTTDPAAVKTDGANNIVQAYLDVALAGQQGKAQFVSRANTSGTVVQEHAIWQQVAALPGASGLTFCTVSAANGGGLAPSTTSGACPTNPTYPSWYVATGVTQGPNIEAANTCTGSSTNDCYVFTDEGTYDCLITASCATSGGNNYADPTNLQVVTSNESASAPGGAFELINTFHAYALNPAKFAGDSNVSINLPAAEDFLNFLTSSSFQSQLSSFLSPASPFHADAAPAISVNGLPSTVTAGKAVTVSGTVTNQCPGTPALAGETVTVSEVGAGGVGVPVATGTTDSAGNYSISFTPPSTGQYQVSTGQITQLENSTISPTFSDVLQPAASTPATVTVQGAVSHFAVRAYGGRVLATGSVSPSSGHVAGTVTLLARKAGSGTFTKVGTRDLAAGDGNFAVEVTRPSGSWQFEATFADPGQVASGTSATATVRVGPASAPQATITSSTVSATGVSLKGRFTAAAASGAKLVVLGMPVAAGSPVGVHQLGTITLRSGAVGYTAHATLDVKGRWFIGLVYYRGGGAPAHLGVLKLVNIS